MIFEDKDRIVFAGDSVTDADKTQPHGDDDALGQGLGVGYVRFVYDMLAAEYPDRNIRITNSGVSGNTSAQLWKRWDSELNVSVYNVYAHHNTWAVTFDQDGEGGVKTQRMYLFSAVPSISYQFKF